MASCTTFGLKPACWQSVMTRQGLEREENAAIDSAPVPSVSYRRGKAASDSVGCADYGVWSSKAMKYFGYKPHRVVSLTGLIPGFLLTPATCYDNEPGVEPLDSFSHHLQRLRLRLICETVNAQEQLHLSKHYARSTWGLMTRIAAKITAHSGGMVLNSFLGRPVLQ